MEDSYIPILMYHSISTSTNPRFERWAVSPALFDEHLTYLEQNHYTPMTVTDFINARASDGALPARPVILTFDDAYADFYENAYPALQRHGFPATLYVPTAYVGGTCTWLREDGEADRPMVSWSQLAEMSANGIECGGHSHAHVQLDTLSLAAAEFEIRRSKELLEEHLGHEVFSFAYPHGWTTGAVKRLAQAAGYTSACAVKNLQSSTTDDAFALARLVVTGSTSVADLDEMMHHRAAQLEVTLRNLARPVVRLAPRGKAWLKSHTPEAQEEPALVAEEEPQREAPAFEPAAMLDIEISQAISISAPTHAETGAEYRRALALVRLHTRPLGVLELFANQDEFSAEPLARRIWQALGPKINEHLREDGLPEVSALDAGGLSYAGAPPCVEAREAFLARAPFVSVVIPTHNRPQNVVRLVSSILASEYPSAQYEIVVVDNAPSSNATALIVEQRFGGQPQVRYVREDRPGTSNARNCGWLNARGEIVVYADDDELVDAHWLTETVRGFDAAENVGGVTGLILPMESETEAQGWFEQFGGYCKEQCDRRLFNLTDHRSENPLYPYTIGSFGAGGSMAFKRSVLEKMGGFDTALGATTPTLGGEDIDGILRVILEGYALVYEPAAIVRHPPYREYAQLRRQIEGYGAGLTACLFKNVVTKPHLLPGFLGKLPRGLLFAFSSRSPHHAGKQTSYPRELTWVELKGLLYGPVAYLRSRGRMALAAPAHAPGAFVEPQAVTVGEMR